MKGVRAESEAMGETDGRAKGRQARASWGGGV